MAQTEHERSRELSTWASLRLMLGPGGGAVVALVAASLLSGLTESVILTIVAQAAAALVDARTRVQTDFGPLHLRASVGQWLDVALVLALVRLAFQGPLSILPARIGAKMQARLRRDVFVAFTRASWSAQSRDREGHLQELLTNQAARASQGSLQAAVFVASAVIIPVLAVMAFVLNVLGAVAVLGSAILLFGVLRPLSARGARRARSLSQAEIVYAGGVSEATRLAEETQVFDAGTAEIARIDGLMSGARDLFFRTEMVSRLVPYLYQSFVYIIVVGGLAILSATRSGHVASLGAVVLLLVRAGTYGQQLQGSLQYVRQAVPYVERLQAAAAGYGESRRPAGRRPLEDIEQLALEHVSFEYQPARPVLFDVSFEVSRGETIGIIGPSGAGKSTIVQILLGLRAPSAGRYLVNGVACDEYASGDWHALVAYVPQVPQLLHATVAQNIRYFRQLDQAAVERAARLARIGEDIASWQHGYETIIGPRADAISGGQRQRICIARALAAHPRVIVLDEPTSALDPASERLLQESLRELKTEATLFVVAHRPATLELCDRVMIVVAGRLEAFDTPAKLRRGHPYYREAAALSLGA